MDTTNLIAYLPFDESATQDLCSNVWTTVGNPTIQDNALYLNGSSYLQNNSIAAEIDTDVWTIHWSANSTASGGEQYSFGTFNANYGTSGEGWNRWIAVNFYNAKPMLVLYGNDSTVNVTLNRNQSYHYALSYDSSSLRFFIDGVLKITKTANVKLGGAFRIGCVGGRTNSADFFKGLINEFIIIKGAAWTENFTPPTAADYDSLKSALGRLQTLNCDVERNITKSLKLNLDVQRNFIQPIIVPFIGEHFNHFVESVTLYRNGAQRIILPKKSEVYIRAIGAGSIKVYSDTDADGKITGFGLYKPADIYAALDECETVYIKLTPKTTAQQTILAFMHALSESTLTGIAGVDAATNYCTGGKFVTKAETGSSSNCLNNEIVDKFINDLNNSASYTDFLRDYCDIILGNEDTGAITGSDAGGIEKTAESVIPEKIPVEDWTVPDYGEVVTINGLNVHFPTRGLDGRFSDIEKHILAGLNSVWIKQGLDLIEETYGLSFNDAGAAIRDITIEFENYTTRNTTAYVSSKINNLGKTTELTLTVNMRYYKDIDMTSVDGLLIPSSQYYYAAGYLDRTIAHELTHAVMAANIYHFDYLPSLIMEGTAELVHGIDDLREDAIVELLTTNKDSVESLLRGLWSPSGAISYAAGYVFLRYLAKQGQNYELIPKELEISNLLISDGATDSNYEALTDNTRQILYSDVLRELIKRAELSLDVEIMDVIRAEFTADVKRALLMQLNVFPMNREDFFSDENNPYVVRT